MLSTSKKSCESFDEVGLPVYNINSSESLFGTKKLPTVTFPRSNLNPSQFIPEVIFMSKLKDRIPTFKNFPKQIKQKPLELAEAGFYYSGVGDECICYHCGIIVKMWEFVDNVWQEHKKHSPNCHHVGIFYLG